MINHNERSTNVANANEAETNVANTNVANANEAETNVANANVANANEAETAPPTNVANANEAETAPPTTLSSQESVKQKGQPSLVKKFPEIIKTATNFIKQHGFSVQCRRRTETGYSSGVSVSEIRTHLMKNVPGLIDHGISKSTVRRLFQPPNKRHTYIYIYIYRDIKVSLMVELEQNLIIFVDTIPITIIYFVETNNATNSVLCLSQMLA